MPPDVTQSF